MTTTPEVSILDVAAFLIDREPHMSTMKLHKLTYLAQGWSLAWTGLPLFEDQFNAWRHGPHSARLFDGHRSAEDRYSVTWITGGDQAKLSGDQQLICEAVSKQYAWLSGPNLSDITMRSRPWAAARKRAGAGPDDVGCDELIEHSDMRAYFSALSDAAALLRGA
jgi:uncharacterized phage-associated protein